MINMQHKKAFYAILYFRGTTIATGEAIVGDGMILNHCYWYSHDHGEGLIVYAKTLKKALTILKKQAVSNIDIKKKELKDAIETKKKLLNMIKEINDGTQN